jgi:hypothetical protein
LRELIFITRLGDLFAMKIYSEEKAQNIDLGFGISLTAVANNEVHNKNNFY